MTEPISEEQLERLAADLAEVMLDLPSLAGLLQIRTKTAGKRPFGWDRWHPEQRRFERERTGRDVVLKPRQIGFSTLELARDFQFARTHEGTQTVIVVHTAEAKIELFAAIHLFAKSLADIGLLPEARENTKTGLRWDDVDSSIKVIEAGKDETTADDRGRSGTIHRLHCTEVAFYRSPEATMTALLEAAGDHAEVVIESTANGVGNWFHRAVTAARRGRFAGFGFHFYAWFEHPTYRVEPGSFPLEPETARERYWEDRLRTLGCDQGQIEWWRQQIEKKAEGGAGGLDKALREYPPTPDAAFEASGDTWLEPEHLDRLESRVRKPVELRPIVIPRRTHRDGTVSPERRFGRLRIYEAPRPRESYLVLGDPSGGVGRDEAALCVMAHGDARIVAAWDDDRTKPADFGNVLAWVGRLYNTALIASEIQLDGKLGRVAIAVLEREERYPRIFEYKPGSPGWSTDPVTRPALFDELGQLIESGRVWTPDEKMAAEVRTLYRDEKTHRVEARGKGTKGGADDGLVVCWGMGIQVRQRVPMPGPVRAEAVGDALVGHKLRI